MQTIGILGTGAFGTALAFHLSKKGIPSLIWGRNRALIHDLRRHRTHPLFPHIFLPQSLHYSSSLHQVVYHSRCLILAIPSTAYLEVLNRIQPLVHPRQSLCFINKGAYCSSLTYEIMAKHQCRYAYLSGVGFAQDIMQDFPFHMVVATPYILLGRYLQRLFSAPSCQATHTTDILTVSLVGIMKNILAIACGMLDGAQKPFALQTALVVAGMREIAQLGMHLGGEMQTILGASGLGDCLLTCLNTSSRNRKFGQLMGQGWSKQAALDHLKSTVEGVHGSVFIEQMMTQKKYYLPLFHSIYQAIHHRSSFDRFIQHCYK